MHMTKAASRSIYNLKTYQSFTLDVVCITPKKEHRMNSGVKETITKGKM